MKPASAAAIYFLFLVASAFILLPFGVKTDEEACTPKVPGQADSAPHRFSFGRHMLKSALLAAVLFALYYANWVYGWVGIEDVDFYN